MRWLPVDAPDLRTMAHADWTGFRLRGAVEMANATAMDRLNALVRLHVNAA